MPFFCKYYVGKYLTGSHAVVVGAAPVPAFIELVEDTRVFANCKSWKKICWAKKSDAFVPLCTPKEYNDYDMVPVSSGGAIQADLVRPCPAAVAVSRFVSAVCVRKNAHSQ